MSQQLVAVESLAGQLLPVTYPEIYQTVTTLERQAEGFFMRSSSRDPCSIGLATPKDELTGLPLPIVISEPKFKSANTSFSDYHHHFHPARDLLNGDDADMALRRSRGQNLPRWLHEHYHKYFAGPEFPETRQEIFATVVLACAGVVPRQAIDFTGSNGGPQIVEVTDKIQHQVLVKSVRNEAEKKGRSNNFYRAQIGMFFANYAIEQSIEEVVSNRLIDEFLETRNNNRRLQLGNLMLREAVRLSVEPIMPVHQELKRQGLIARRQTDLPARVHDFFVRSRRVDYHLALERKWKPEVTINVA